MTPRTHTLKDHKQWVEVHIRDGSDVTETDLLAFRAELHDIEAWSSKPVLIHMGTLNSVSLAARERLGRYQHPTSVAVLGTTPMDEVIASFLLRSPTHARYFTTYADALLWLGTD